ncbi:MAG: hypothetical protein JSS23_03265 [Proteobacteria bacterium]|nr:hypothetical protein [Pseudomonadota bacterium]
MARIRTIKPEFFTSDDFASVKRFVEQLGVEPVLDAVEIALDSSVPDRAVFKYLCGVCWNKVREVPE